MCPVYHFCASKLDYRHTFLPSRYDPAPQGAFWDSARETYVNRPHGERDWQPARGRPATVANLAMAPLVRVRGYLGLVVLLAGVAGLLYGLSPRTASAASGTIAECTETQLRADVTAGGTYTFAC